MRRFVVILLVLPILACAGLSTPIPSTGTSVFASRTSAPPTAILPTSTSAQISATATLANASAFPDPNAFTWNQIVSGLQRLTDLEPDGSGRLFIVEKVG